MPRTNKAAETRRETASLHDAIKWGLGAGLLIIHDTHLAVNLTRGRGRPMWRRYETLQDAAEVLRTRMDTESHTPAPQPEEPK